MINSNEFHPEPQGKKQGRMFWYVVLALAFVIIIAHYKLVLPYLSSFGI